MIKNKLLIKIIIFCRNMLVRLMDNQGFNNYEYEWWHYTLREEPFPETYFDFPIQTECGSFSAH